MGNRENVREKRTQLDYMMSFKLGIVTRVGKGRIYLQAVIKALWHPSKKLRFDLASEMW